MSLDVTLKGETRVVPCYCSCGHEHTTTETEYLYESNITHNLNTMAGEAGIYAALWRPEDIGATKAKDIIEPLKQGLQKLKADPKHFEQFNASNGWGKYEHLVGFVQSYLNACIEYPDAEISVSR